MGRSQEYEARVKRARQLLAEGHRRCDVARMVGVHVGTVSRWAQEGLIPGFYDDRVTNCRSDPDPEMLTELRELRERGEITLEEAAGRFGASISTLVKWSQEGLLPRRSASEVRHARIIQRIRRVWDSQGPFATYREWARTARCDEATLHRFKKHLSRPVRLDPDKVDSLLDGCRTERDADMVIRRSAGETLEEIGDRYGVSRERVRQILAKVVRRAEVADGT